MYEAELLLAQAHDHQRDMIAEMDRYRLLASARRSRRGRRARDARGTTPVRGRPAGTVNGCGQHEVARAR